MTNCCLSSLRPSLLALLVATTALAQESGAPPASDVPRVDAERSIQAVPDAPPAEAPPAAVSADEVPSGAVVEGHLRHGAFLSGPGSLAFVLHHTLMGAGGGLVTQGIASGFKFDKGSREAMLVGTLVGAGLGAVSSSWWQFNHWIDRPMAYSGIVNSAASGLFFLGLMDLMTDNSLALSWTGFLGMEVGAWLTTTLGGGDMPLNDGLFVASGAGWGVAYSALLLAIIGNSGTKIRSERAFDAMAIGAGVGAGLSALATLKFHPTSMQILRADAFGAGIGGAVLLLSALALGDFRIATPYVLSLLSSAGAIAAVSVFWAESAERPARAYLGDDKSRPYRTVWW